jgi:hypothetical protein
MGAPEDMGIAPLLMRWSDRLYKVRLSESPTGAKRREFKSQRRKVMILRNGCFRPIICLLSAGIGFLFMWGCGDDTSTGPGQEDPTRITMQLTAIVSTIEDPNNVLGGLVTVGDTIAGTYIYDSTVEDTYPDPAIGRYSHSSAPYGIFLEINGYEFKTDLNDVDFLVEISDDRGSPAYDFYIVRSYNNAMLTFNVAVDHIFWQLEDETATAVSSVELTTSPPDLADWTSVWGLTVEGHSTAEPWPEFEFSSQVSEISRVQ